MVVRGFHSHEDGILVKLSLWLIDAGVSFSWLCDLALASLLAFRRWMIMGSHYFLWLVLRFSLSNSYRGGVVARSKLGFGGSNMFP